ncbi:DUF5685 family protein [Stackebrandtia nassauensis]|uniref:Regulatory protein n=1 Tax=Stackebrandtia nassauensis (strain DSM 44728 / CIP 108903 / NRRL B-16338 / NBRC 102104 / LLR-40K-21) TaxID=446470 RepID=D3Q5R2_STANL|nr:DUF5685 family protein [Stackebrandtia nassauensis]ADD40211.1 hypothetical protein Snas_0496 [Stackebrandtia nassauensis DSM 44728]
MFGLLRPCSRLMDEPMLHEWLSHFCGLCLALRDDFGQSTRLATNYDSLVLSALVEAQTGAEPQRRTAGPCALRGLRTASVVHGTAARLSAVASVLLATAKINDHIDDGDGLARRRSLATVGRKVSRRLETKALRVGDDIDFDAAALLAAVGRQREVEAGASASTPLTAVTAPTEEATAALFGHTAVMAGRPDNAAPLARAGRAFGRLAHLVDAVSDLEQDGQRGSWNPLAATETPMAEAHRLCHAAIADIDAALAEAGIGPGELARSLLVDHAEHTMRNSYPHAHHHQHHGAHPAPRGFWAGCGAALIVACTCQCCCSSNFEGPWSRRPREGCCHKCDCCDCPCDGCCCPCD